jgi:hypothetical protein
MVDQGKLGGEGEAIAASAAYVFIAKEAIGQGKKIESEYIHWDKESNEILIYVVIGRQTEWFNIGIDENNKPTGGCFALSNPDDFQACILNDTDVDAVWAGYGVPEWFIAGSLVDEHMEEVIRVFGTNRDVSPETIELMSIRARAMLNAFEDMESKYKKGRKIN